MIQLISFLPRKDFVTLIFQRTFYSIQSIKNLSICRSVFIQSFTPLSTAHTNAYTYTDIYVYVYIYIYIYIYNPEVLLSLFWVVSCYYECQMERTVTILSARIKKIILMLFRHTCMCPPTSTPKHIYENNFCNKNKYNLHYFPLKLNICSIVIIKVNKDCRGNHFLKTFKTKRSSQVFMHFCQFHNSYQTSLRQKPDDQFRIRKIIVTPQKRMF